MKKVTLTQLDSLVRMADNLENIHSVFMDLGDRDAGALLINEFVKLTLEGRVTVTEKGIVTAREHRIAREKQRKNQNMFRKERDNALRSLGLKKVRGAISGNIYWE